MDIDTGMFMIALFTFIFLLINTTQRKEEK